MIIISNNKGGRKMKQKKLVLLLLLFLVMVCKGDDVEEGVYDPGDSLVGYISITDERDY